MTDASNEKPRGVDALVSTPQPPRDLEARTLERLGALGLVRARARWRWLYVAAAFVLGLVAGSLPIQSQDARYLLLLEGGSTPTGMEEDEHVREYAAWARRLRDEGVHVSGERLAGDVRRIGESGGDRSDIRGFFLYDADSDEDAAVIANSCPHLRYGGGVLLGRIASEP